MTVRGKTPVAPPEAATKPSSFESTAGPFAHSGIHNLSEKGGGSAGGFLPQS